jgi:hypothetical protein
MKQKEKAGTVATVTDLNNHSIAGGNQKAYDVFDYAKTTAKKQQDCFLCNLSLENRHGKATICNTCQTEADRLASALATHLSKPRKVVKTVRCLSCRSNVTPAKFSIFWGVCKTCVTEARGKSKLAQSNFIERTLNNVRKNLRGALQNV